MSFEGNEYDKDVDGRVIHGHGFKPRRPFFFFFLRHSWRWLPARCLKWHLKLERRRKHTSLLKCITSAPETLKPCLNDAA